MARPSIGDEELGSRWLSSVSDDVRVNELAIPGTRASCSYLLDKNPKLTGYQTQTWNIRDQLRSGIRFFDLNLNFKNTQPLSPDAIDQMIS